MGEGLCEAGIAVAGHECGIAAAGSFDLPSAANGAFTDDSDVLQACRSPGKQSASP